MSSLARRHTENVSAIQFNSESSISLNKVNWCQQTIIMLIELNRYEDRMQILALDLYSKDKEKERLYIILEIDTMEHTKRTVVVLVESQTDNNMRILERQPVAYINDNYNEFLFVVKFTEKGLDLCINSSYFNISLSSFKCKTEKNI